MTIFPALSLKPANVVGSYIEGKQAREQSELRNISKTNALDELKAKREQRDKQKEIDRLGESIAGDKDPLSKLMALDPEMGTTLQKYQQDRAQKKLMDTAKIAATIKQANPEMKNQAYLQGLEQAAAQGIDISEMPPEYTPEVEPILDQLINSARSLEDVLVGGETKIVKPGESLVKGSDAIYTAPSEGKIMKPGDILVEDGKAVYEAPDKPEKFTTAENQAAGFGLRMQESNDIINSIGADFTGFWSRPAKYVMEGMKSDDRQKFEQAERNFINATLRRESGAAIAPEEFVSAREQYIPQPGDGDDVVAQKARNRLAVQQSLIQEAGGAFDKLKGSMPPLPDLNKIHEPQTQEDFDKLPSGSKFKNPSDGNTRTKK
jgi:hypothetical protein